MVSLICIKLHELFRQPSNVPFVRTSVECVNYRGTHNLTKVNVRVCVRVTQQLSQKCNFTICNIPNGMSSPLPPNPKDINVVNIFLKNGKLCILILT